MVVGVERRSKLVGDVVRGKGPGGQRTNREEPNYTLRSTVTSILYFKNVDYTHRRRRENIVILFGSRA